MTADVYFANLRARSPEKNIPSKIGRLYDAAGFAEVISRTEPTALKLHFGEEGNTSYLHPVFVARVVAKIRESGGIPFLTDTNTLYLGSRQNAVDHLTTAIGHGFAYSVVKAPVIIADGLKGDDWTSVPVGGRHISSAMIAGTIRVSGAMIVMSHFKGHGLAGFGGAIKNLAMGCAPPAGKHEQHAPLHPRTDSDICIGCGRCAEECPEGAVILEDGRAVIDHGRCVGCGACAAVCETGAVVFDWEHDVPVFLELMAEYALAAVAGKERRMGYYNFLMGITPDCDCVSWSDAPFVPDIGILASTDPVAIDQASLDLVNRQYGLAGTILSGASEPGENKFRQVWPEIDGGHILDYAEEIGLGEKKYRLIEI
jgi:uncharacterized Fe-S center protein